MILQGKPSWLHTSGTFRLCKTVLRSRNCGERGCSEMGPTGPSVLPGTARVQPTALGQSCSKASSLPRPLLLFPGSSTGETSAHPKPPLTQALAREGQCWGGSLGQHFGMESGSGRALQGGLAQANKAQRTQVAFLPQPGVLALVSHC